MGGGNYLLRLSVFVTAIFEIIIFISIYHVVLRKRLAVTQAAPSEVYDVLKSRQCWRTIHRMGILLHPPPPPPPLLP